LNPNEKEEKILLKLESIRIQPGDGADILRRKCAKLLRIQEKDIVSLRLLKQSIDARESVDLVCSVLVALKHENAVLRRIHDRRITLYTPPPAYMPPEKLPAPKTPPVVVGAGPAGLFCTLILAEAGLHPILLERGKPVEQRQQDVLHFWESGVLNLSSNVQFGEGGAGAFSDGKLNTGTKNPRHRYILEEFTACGAPETILTDAMPHMGTDYLHIVLTALRSKLIALGADVRFESRLADLHLEDGTLVSAVIDGLDGTYFLPCQQLVLAPGHSARDTFEMLHARGVPMEAKPFAVGVRIEHRQSDMDAAQYRQYAGHPGLPASSYRLACHLPNGRSAYSFCVCPGGEVVAAASETNRVVTNGMSEFARDRENINGALLINVTPSDFLFSDSWKAQLMRWAEGTIPRRFNWWGIFWPDVPPLARDAFFQATAPSCATATCGSVSRN
jgi:uncharacterized FAD-dependent dehydrogenase